MKRKYGIVLILLMCIGFFGCNDPGNSNALDAPTGNNEFSYIVLAEPQVFSANNDQIEIQYPSFDHETQNCEKLNLLLRSAIQDHLNTYGDDLSGLSLNADYQITFANDEIISIVFRGESDTVGAAHPIQFAFAINILVTDPRIADNASILNVGDETVQGIVAQARLQNGSAIREYIEGLSADEIKRELQHEDVSFYLTNQGVGVIFPIPHSLGDYTEFVLQDK